MALQEFWIPTPRYELVGGLRSPGEDRRDQIQKLKHYTVFGPLELSVWYNKLHSTSAAYFPEIKDSVMSSYRKALRFGSNSLEDLLRSPEKSLFKSVRTENFDISMEYSSIKETKSLFKRVLQEYLVKERLADPHKKVEEMLENKGFLKSMLACSFECYLFVKNITNLPLEEILARFEVTAFDFWKQIHTFALLLKQIPRCFLIFLNQLESKILNKMIWSAGSGFSDTIKFLSKNEGVSPSVKLILKKVCRFSNERVYRICNEIGLSESVTKEIWTTVQHYLSEHTEYLLGSSIDQLIVSAIYRVCKPLTGFPMNKIIQKFIDIFPNTDLGQNTKVFYKKTFALVMKRSNGIPLVPRIPELVQDQPLLKNVPKEMFSPAWLTTRSGKISHNTTIQRASRRINFNDYELPAKKSNN